MPHPDEALGIAISAAALAAGPALDPPTIQPVGALPSSLVGLAAAAGIASTFLRSDATLALDQGIAPLWSANHTWANGIFIQWKDLGGTTRSVLGMSNVAGSDRLLLNCNGATPFFLLQVAGAAALNSDGIKHTFSQPVVVPSYIVATLPAFGTIGAGGLAMVTDATLTMITGLGLAPVGGGANKVPVFDDGTGWKII